jgi:osmotically-inducible protein OsmY
MGTPTMQSLDGKKRTVNVLLSDQNSIPEKEAVLTEARLRFQRAPYEELHNVQFDFHKGVLTLRGRVPSSFFKQIAQSIVFSMERIDMIDNRLEVLGP